MPRVLVHHGPAPEILAARIKAERERLGLTRTAAAERLGVHRRSYDQLERSANPTIVTLFALIEVLGMRPKSLLPELYGKV